ncbi:hypothetical protein LJ656_17030 [Paraburkholderia sp. MMS20-SJTR3]|uniref:Lipoprotein-attachment site-containing protein n=1 Tax=Paraburkholderia sejongensis TaxID=2886946 RepID=A0ABS8JWL4_9BURK|nr:hypothetical protein [Paraburkholderia sp. MMS20-SJTR3]MCC8394302.1 hypothetical protein [Paraburkholderia sp. MMS20-SJTR3]
MPLVSKPFRAPSRKRLARALTLGVLCALAAGCGNDDKTNRTPTLSATEHSAANSFNGSGDAPPGTPAPAILTIQTPAASSSDAGTALSATAPPLAPPMIHSVD